MSIAAIDRRKPAARPSVDDHRPSRAAKEWRATLVPSDVTIHEAIRAIDGNVSADLTLFSTLARVGGSRAGEGAWPAAPTARWDV